MKQPSTPLGPFLVPIMTANSFSGSLLPPGKSRAVVTTAILGTLLTLIVGNPTINSSSDALIPFQGPLLFVQWVDFYILHTPEKEFWRVKDMKSNQPQRNASNTSWDSSCSGFLNLKTSLRGIGWICNQTP